MNLVNLTNHPQSEWSSAQREWFDARYNRLIDLPFPPIHPESTSREVFELAESIMPMVLAFAPCHLLVMGESTFMVAMVRLAQCAGLRVIATTSRRNVELLDDGRMIRRFEFVGTREFQPLCNDR
jgi:hypothetical protein